MRNPLRSLYRALLSERLRARLRPLAYPGITIFRALLWRASQGRVFSGPFTGLRLAPPPILPHLLGTYERELHEVVESLCGHPWKKIVNVGGGSGYYIAGLGHRVTGADLVVFDLEAEAREVIADTLARNGLSSRARVLGAADPVSLEAACAGVGPALVVMDVEGAELELADPVLVPSLLRATILLETHDVIRPGCRDVVAARFSSTHRVSVIASCVRTLDDYPALLSPLLRRLAPARCLDAVQEQRGGLQDWLLLTPRAG